MRWIVRQWADLNREWAPQAASADEEVRTLGVYALALLCLCAAHYGGSELWRVLPLPGAGEDSDYAQRLGWVLGVTLIYLVPPLIYARWVLGFSPRDLGLRLEGLREHAGLHLKLLAVVLPCVLIASTSEAFQSAYPLARSAPESASRLLLWELCYGLHFVAVEVFFRGFLIFGAVRVLGPMVLPAMVVPFCLVHFGKPWPEAVGAIAAGTALGLLALRTGSVVGGILLHLVVAWTMDAAVLAQTGRLRALLAD